MFAITSLPPDQASAAELAGLVRGHWGIENRLHWVRDTAYREDASQVRTGNAAHLMATIRNLAISLHRLAGASRVQFCIVHKLDRLARNRPDDVKIHEALINAGVTLVSATESIDQTPSGCWCMASCRPLPSSTAAPSQPKSPRA